MTDPDDRKHISDGHHTFAELYAHRRALTLALMRAFPQDSFRTRHHHPDDNVPMFDGCFLVGIDTPAGDIRYHVGVEHWSLFDGIRTVPHAPPWDGAGPAETVARLHAWWPERRALADPDVSPAPDRADTVAGRLLGAHQTSPLMRRAQREEDGE